jgi:hypothetical protein
MKKYRVSSKRKELYRLTYTIYDFYESFEAKDKIDKEVFINLIKDFFTLYFEKIVIERKRYKLPHHLGTHRIKKRKLSSYIHPKIDFNSTKKLGKTVYHLNKHTNGYYFKWYWDKDNIRLKNKSFYIFELTKKNTTSLAKEIIRCAKDPYLKDYDALT